jgi:RNA polymerase sigma-70 factor (ECF subfamily)
VVHAAAPAASVETRPLVEDQLETSALTPTAPPPGGGLTPDQARRFRDVVLAHADPAYNLALRLCRRADVAEDIVNDAYVRALSGFADFRGGDGRSWILTIVRNRFYDWLREQRLKATVPLGRASDDPDGDDDWDIPDLDQDTPEQALAKKGEAGALHAMIDRLPPRLREVLVLREMEELSYREIAEVTAAPIGSVMSRLSRAREALAEAWRAHEAKVVEARA